MNSQDQISRLEETKSQIIKFTEDLARMRENNEIDGIEYNLILNEKLEGKTRSELLTHIDSEILKLQSMHSESQGQNRHVVAVGSTVLALILIGAVAFMITDSNGPTGLVTKESTELTQYNQEFTSVTETTLDLEKITSLKISGSMRGSAADVWLKAGDQEYLVAELLATSEVYSLETDKAIYALGEPITITLSPANASAEIYFAQGNETHLADGTYAPNAFGDYQVIAMITTENDIISLTTNISISNESSNVTQSNRVETGGQGSLTFSELCVETCSLPEMTDPVLIIEPAEDTTLTIDQLVTVQQVENEAPFQIESIDDQVTGESQEITLDLDRYFDDVDDETLNYDVLEVGGITSSITGNQLSLSSAENGEYAMVVYASDGNTVITSNEFTITVGDEPVPESPEPPITPVEEFTDCNDPNPNKRPIDCIQGNEEDYFSDKSIFLENLDRQQVARVTAFGNLVLRGNVITDSASSPGTRDFRLSIPSSDGESESVTVWIDSDSGDLHLRGDVFEEQFSLLPGEQSFVIQNKKGTNLGYFDRTSGNLFLRGNVVEEKEE